MKQLIACASVVLALALPVVSYARDHHSDRDDRGDYRDRGGHDREDRSYYDDRERHDRHDRYRWHAGGPIRFIGHVIALPFEVGAAVIGATVDVVTAPLYPRNNYPAPAAQGYYDQPEAYYERDERDERRQYEAPPGRVYSAQPEYYPPQPVYRGY